MSRIIKVIVILIIICCNVLFTSVFLAGDGYWLGKDILRDFIFIIWMTGVHYCAFKSWLEVLEEWRKKDDE